MRGWKTDIVVSLGAGKGTINVNVIREDAVIICGTSNGSQEMYYDLGTGLLHRTDPSGDLLPNGNTKAVDYIDVGWATPTLEQFVAAVANQQVKADHLYQGLKASSVDLPSGVKFVRSYLGGVLVFRRGERIFLGAMIDFIMKGFDKE